jgi:hypothetical protein
MQVAQIIQGDISDPVKVFLLGNGANGSIAPFYLARKRLSAPFKWGVFKKFIEAYRYVLVESLRSPFHLIDGKDIGDGSALARLTYLPEIIWIVVWALIAIGLILMLYRRAAN